MNGSQWKKACQLWLDSMAISRLQIIVIIILLLPLISGLFITHWHKSKKISFQTSYNGAENLQLTIKVAEIESLWYEAKQGNDSQEIGAIHKKLDLNQASIDELISLPGIGATLAQRIVTYRVQKGGFSSVAELVQVPGIGKKKYEKIAPYLIVKEVKPFTKSASDTVIR